MGMNKVNREDPFMYLLEMKEMELKDKTYSAIKNTIKFCIISITAIILSIIRFFITDVFSFSHLGFSISIIVFILMELCLAIKSVKHKKIEEMIFGDNYRFIDLNNEKLLSMINAYNTWIGKVDMLLESIYWFNIVFIISISVNTLYFLIIILK